MKKSIRYILLSSLLFFGSIFTLSSCIKTDKVVENEEIQNDDPLNQDFEEEIIISVVEETKNEDVEILVSESSEFGPIHYINFNNENPYIGTSGVQISAVNGDKVNLRYVFEIKTLDCDVSITYKMFESDKTTIYKEERTMPINTVYRGYYNGEELITKEGSWFVVFTMRNIPSNYWDYFLDVNCSLYELNSVTELASFEASKNALTVLYDENNSVLNSDFEFELSTDKDYYSITGYNGSETVIKVPDTKPYKLDNDDVIYLPVSKINSNSLKNSIEETIVLPDSVDEIEINSFDSNDLILTDKDSLSNIANNSVNDIFVYAEFFQENAWHYKDGTPKLWSKSISINDTIGANETAIVNFNVVRDAKPSDFNVYYAKYDKDDINFSKFDNDNYTKIDNDLVLIDGIEANAYVVGLEPGLYYFKVELADDVTEYQISNGTYVSAQDRSGYAHYNYIDGVGAYNDDGTLKDNAVVVYVTDVNKNDVEAKIGENTYSGLANILKNADENYPLDIRIIGSIKTTQFNSITFDKSKAKLKSLLDEQAATLGGTYASYRERATDDKKSIDIKASEIISNGWNSYSNDIAKGITTLEGLTSKVKFSTSGVHCSTSDPASSDYYDMAFDTYWNMMEPQYKKNITIEGIGNDAEIYQWGFLFKSCDSIEVKNLTFTDYPEDACSAEGGGNDKNNFGNYWIHNCTFNRGLSNWDFSDEQDKNDGDGATDYRYCHNVTLSYNQYNGTHKTGLIGSGSSNLQYNFTLHHNFYNNCEARLPYSRQANIHMYNNYYFTDGSLSSKQIFQIYDKAYALLENCYIEGYTNPLKLSNSGVMKAVNNNISITGASNVSREETVTNSCKPDGTTDYSNFDTDSTLFYYDSTKNCSIVTIMTDTNKVPTFVPAHAGAGNYYLSLGIGTEEEIGNLDLNLYNLSGSNGTYFTNYVKTIYKVGDAFNYSFLSLNVDGDYTMLPDYSISGYLPTAGKHTITVDYKNLSATYDVYVLPDSEYYNVYVGENCSVGDVIKLDGKDFIAFNTVEQALEYLREFTHPTVTNRAYLYISAGEYYEKLEIDVPYLTIEGAGYTKATSNMDESFNATEYASATIIEWDSLYGVKETGITNDTNSTATVEIKSSAVGLEIKNLTISNKNNCYSYFTNVVGSHAEHRALALLVRADQFVMNNSALLGYQDTLELMTGRQYFYNCYISGTTDYIFGTNNSTLFDNCIIHTIYNGNTSAGGYITAFKGCHSDASDSINYGATFYQCILEGDSNTVNVSLGRPWGSYAQVSYIECEMADCISTTEYTNGTSQGQRYVDMSGVKPTDTNVRFYEYGNTGAGSISSTQNGMTYLEAEDAAKTYDYSYIFSKTNGGVSFALAWDPINGQEKDNNIYYFFNGRDSDTGTVYRYFNSIEGASTTLGDLTLDATTGKLAKRDFDSQMNLGTKILYTALAGSSLNVKFYNTNYSINGVAASSTSMTMYFEEETDVTILATGNNYIYSIIINNYAVEETTVDSLIFIGEVDAINVGDTLPINNLEVYAISSNGIYFKVNNYNISISDGVNTYNTSDEIDVAGTYDVTISYNAVEVQYELEVVGDEVLLTYVFDFNSTDAEEADTATTKNYQIPASFTIQNNTGTIGDDFIINVDATTGKLASATNGYTQFNSGTKMTFTAPYDCNITLVSYQAAQASINGILSTTKTLSLDFAKDTEIVILGTANGYLTSLTITPKDSITSNVITSITATSTTDEIALNDTFDQSTITVKAWYNSTNTLYGIIDNSNCEFEGIITSSVGEKTVTVSYNNLETTFKFTVSASVDTTISETIALSFGGSRYNLTNQINANSSADGCYKITSTSETTIAKVTFVNCSSNGDDNWLKFNNGGTISFDVASACTLKIYTYDGTLFFNVDLDGNAISTQTSTEGASYQTGYVYNVSGAGTVTITATSSYYLGCIEIAF